MLTPVKVIVFGTRPEFIKLLPVFIEIESRGIRNNFFYIYTGQHHDLLNSFFDLFNFSPDLVLETGKHHNSISDSFSEIFDKLNKAFKMLMQEKNVELIFGQGDTSSCASAAMFGFMNRIPFAHIEAGLRTFDLNHPYPEEYYRQIITISSSVHFAPTEMSRQNLLDSGVASDQIIITGNTGIDSIEIYKNEKHYKSENSSKNIVLITCHRRENQNENLSLLFETVTKLATRNSTMNFIWISHKNIKVEKFINSLDGNYPANISISEPICVDKIYELFNDTALIITDSGGLQEEAPSFNIPVIVVRNITERMEGVNLGYSFLTGMDTNKIIETFDQIIISKRETMKNPYGDGKAAKRIVDYVYENF